MVEKYGRENVVVILGSPDPDSTEIYAETVVSGDPTYAGPLTNANLRLPVFHVLEREVKEAVDAETYEQHVGLMEQVLDSGRIIDAVRRFREAAS